MKEDIKKQDDSLIEVDTLEYFSNIEEERNLTRTQGVKIYNPDTGCFVPGCYQRLAYSMMD